MRRAAAFGKLLEPDPFIVDDDDLPRLDIFDLLGPEPEVEERDAFTGGGKEMFFLGREFNWSRLQSNRGKTRLEVKGLGSQWQ